MTSFEKKYNSFEKKIGGLKFAVILLALFALMMTIGTFSESYYGTDFTNRFIYKKWPFMLLQFLMLLSIIFAAFRRLPAKKRLYGFYTIHTGLVIVGVGSFITFYAGIDGSLILPPNSPSREIILGDDQFKISFPDENREVKTKLPYVSGETYIGHKYQNITLGRYYPFAEKEFQWNSPKKVYGDVGVHSSRYSIANEMVAQEMTLSLHPESIDFQSSITMGLLQVHYLPEALSSCFALKNKSKLMIWDSNKTQCFTPEDKKISIQKAATGRRFFVYKDGSRYYSFFPEASPWPLDSSMKSLTNSHLRVFSKSLFEDKAHLFLFGKSLAYYNKDEKKWIHSIINKETPHELPWMGFELSLLQHETNKVPNLIPIPTLPIQKDNVIIKGNTRALEFIIDKQSYWVTNDSPLQLRIRGKKAIFQLQKESVFLPFEIVLDRFKMNMSPGTNRPASYESFVRLFSNNEPTKHHIFMNNPLKYSGFTFYQASYSQDNQGNYSSTLSVNVDPGRFLKYLGSLLLVLGSLWHYKLNYRKKDDKDITPLISGTAS
jgi:hypothetical protein